MRLTAIGLSAALAALLTGCVVSQSTHEQVLQDLQATKSDLDRLRVQNESLNKQLKVLQDSRSKLKEDLDSANSEMASLNAIATKERQLMENKLKDLDRQVKDVMASKRILAQDLEVQKQKYEAAQKTIKRQQKELKEREQAELIPAKPFSGVPEPQKPIEPSLDTGKPSPIPPRPAMKPAPQEPMKSAGPSIPFGLVDINKASEADLVLSLGLGKDDSQKLLRHRPYATKDELVSKAGLTKPTFDRIKDKITVSP